MFNKPAIALVMLATLTACGASVYDHKAVPSYKQFLALSKRTTDANEQKNYNMGLSWVQNHHYKPGQFTVQQILFHGETILTEKDNARQEIADKAAQAKAHQENEKRNALAEQKIHEESQQLMNYLTRNGSVMFDSVTISSSSITVVVNADIWEDLKTDQDKILRKEITIGSVMLFEQKRHGDNLPEYAKVIEIKDLAGSTLATNLW